MKFKEYEELFDNIINDIKDIRKKKSNDYASDEDTLKNFKELAKINNMTPAQVAMFFMTVKLQRLNNLNGRHPENEAIIDTVVDLINYAGLYYACLIDSSPSVDDYTDADITLDDLDFEKVQKEIDAASVASEKEIIDESTDAVVGRKVKCIHAQNDMNGDLVEGNVYTVEKVKGDW